MSAATYLACTGIAAALTIAGITEYLHRRDRHRQHPPINGTVIAARTTTVPLTSRWRSTRNNMTRRLYQLLVDNHGAYAWITCSPTTWDRYVTQDPTLAITTLPTTR